MESSLSKLNSDSKYIVPKNIRRPLPPTSFAGVVAKVFQHCRFPFVPNDHNNINDSDDPTTVLQKLGILTSYACPTTRKDQGSITTIKFQKPESESGLCRQFESTCDFQDGILIAANMKQSFSVPDDCKAQSKLKEIQDISTRTLGKFPSHNRKASARCVSSSDSVSPNQQKETESDNYKAKWQKTIDKVHNSEIHKINGQEKNKSNFVCTYPVAERMTRIPAKQCYMNPTMNKAIDISYTASKAKPDKKSNVQGKIPYKEQTQYDSTRGTHHAKDRPHAQIKCQPHTSDSAYEVSQYLVNDCIQTSRPVAGDITARNARVFPGVCRKTKPDGIADLDGDAYSNQAESDPYCQSEYGHRPHYRSQGRGRFEEHCNNVTNNYRHRDTKTGNM